MACQSPTSSTQSSAVGSCRCSSVGTARSGRASRPAWCIRRAAPHSAGSRRTSSRPRRLRRPEARVEPRQERHRAEGRVGELGDQLAEAGRLGRPASRTRPRWARSARPARRTAPGRPRGPPPGSRSRRRPRRRAPRRAPPAPRSCVSGGVAVSPSTTASGSCSSSSPSSRPQTSSRWWHSSSTSSDRSGVAQRGHQRPAVVVQPRHQRRLGRALLARPRRRGRRPRRPGRSARSAAGPGRAPCRPSGPTSACLVDPLALDRGVGPQDDGLVGAGRPQRAGARSPARPASCPLPAAAPPRRGVRPAAQARSSASSASAWCAPQPHPQKIRSTTACARRVVRR